MGYIGTSKQVLASINPKMHSAGASPHACHVRRGPSEENACSASRRVNLEPVTIVGWGSWNPGTLPLNKWVGCQLDDEPNLYLGNGLRVRFLDALFFLGGEILKTGIFIICIYFSAI